MKNRIVYDNLNEKGKSSSITFSFYVSCIFLLVILILLQTLRTFFFSSIVVVGKSMQNTVSDGDVLLVCVTDKPERGDIVVFAQTEIDEDGNLVNRKDSNGINQYYIKRIIGLEGDNVSWYNNEVTLTYTNKDGIRVTEILNESYVSSPTNGSSPVGGIDVPKGCMFVMGDNRADSADSRYYMGCVDKKLILGIVPQFVVDVKDNYFWQSIFSVF